jgi:spermidine/putrescine transport system ATP-binding protein
VASDARAHLVADPTAEERAEPVVQLEHVSKAFRGTTAVNDLSLTLFRGEFFSLLGPSGCGKTTTLRMIGGFEQPDSGRILLAGRDAGRTPPNRRPVNTVFQTYALFSHLNVYDNVAFGLKEQRRPKAEIRDAVSEALALVQLQGYERRRTRQLSGGQQQRVALARAIVNRPTVLLLDEPLGALDLKLRRAMQVELKLLQRTLGITFLYVTHDQEEALTMSDRIGVMEAGRLNQVGTPEEIYNRPLTPYVADFVGEANMLRCAVVAARANELVFRFASGDEGTAPGEAELAPGALARLVIRPEKVDIARVDAAQSPAAGALHGTVVEEFFLGSHHRFLVELPDDQRVTVLLANRGSGGGRPSAGDTVRLTWTAEDAWLIGDSPVAIHAADEPTA